MKYLMKVGDQLDLNVSYDGGAVDGVTYQAVGDVSVTSAGIVTALALGEGVVNVLNGSDVLGSIVFEVLTAGEYAAKQSIRDGSKELSVDADSVPQGPPPEGQISFNNMTSASQGGYTAFSNDNLIAQGFPVYLAFDGQVVGSWHPTFYVPNPGNTQLLGQILPVAKTLTRYEIRSSGATDVQKWRIEGSNNTTTGFDGTWVTVDDRPDYQGWSGAMNVASSFTVTNSTAYKAYRIVVPHNPVYAQAAWKCAELTLFGH